MVHATVLFTTIALTCHKAVYM